MAKPDRERISAALLAERRRFVAYLADRLGGAAEAEDVLQDSLVRALDREDDLHDEARAVGWLFGVLRHAVLDHWRSRNATDRRGQAWAETVGGADAETERRLCGCLAAVVETMAPRAAELIRRVELGGATVREAGAALGLEEIAAGVALHRARRELRGRLSAWCGDCTATACLDCDCEDEERTRS